MTRKGVWDLQQVRDKYLDGAWENYGSYYSWGSGNYGQLGASIVPSRSSPVQVPGKWNALGGHNFGGSGIKDDGTLWSWGFNSDGQLGINNSNPANYAATQIGTDTDWSICSKSKSKFQYFIKTDGTLYATGYNQNGRLGLGAPGNASYSSPTQIPGTYKWVASGQAGAHAVKTDGSFWGWGLSSNGRIGITPLDTISSPKQLPGTDWAWCAEAENSSMATKTDGSLWAWGKNNGGQLGQNSRTDYSSPRQIPGTTWNYDDQFKIAMQDEQLTAAIKQDGSLWMWGYNHTGALGQNQPMPTLQSSPVQVPGNWNSVDIGGTDPTVIATKTDGTAWAWGYAGEGRFGVNNTTPQSSPVQIPGTKWAGETHTGRGAMYALQKSLTPSQL